MPNYCNFTAMIKGPEANVNKMIEIFQRTDYKDGPHMYRIFEASHDEADNDTYDDGELSAMIDGYCAWSVADCMMPGIGYFEEEKMSPNEYSLVEASHDLKLQVEIYSEEPGNGFQEHYYVKNGEVLIDEVAKDFQSVFTDDYDSVEEFNDQTQLNISKEQFESEDFIEAGGFEEWSFDAIQ